MAESDTALRCKYPRDTYHTSLPHSCLKALNFLPAHGNDIATLTESLRQISSQHLVDTTSHITSKLFKMSSGKVKAGALWGKNKDDLTKQLAELKTELGQLRIQKVASSGSKLNRIHDIRKSIARVLTVINAKQRAQLRLFYKNKKYAPLDLRPKQTRAIRRRLSPEEKSRVLEKTKKRTVHFPQRKFAIKVR
ncbi:unnamed protein product [Fusarium fujikuroi]|nr:unnamed protein product [Fusarium fujikuroi]